MSNIKKRQVKTYLSTGAFALLAHASRRAGQPMTRVIEMLIRHHLPFMDVTDPDTVKELKSYRQPEKGTSHGHEDEEDERA